MIHSGSRGLGHQVATDALVEMEAAMARDGIKTNDRQLACARISSKEGQVCSRLSVCLWVGGWWVLCLSVTSLQCESVFCKQLAHVRALETLQKACLVRPGQSSRQTAAIPAVDRLGTPTRR